MVDQAEGHEYSNNSNYNEFLSAEIRPGPGTEMKVISTTYSKWDLCILQPMCMGISLK